MRGPRVSSILFALAVLAVRPVAEAQQEQDDPEKIIAGLRQLAFELNEAVKRSQRHLDREIAMHDRGYRAKTGSRIPGADADFDGGQPDLVQTALRKLFAARMISARRPGYEPIPLADYDRIQALILDARSRIDRSNEVERRLLVVPAKDLNPRDYAAEKARQFELLKARSAAAEAAKKAFVALPVALPEADSPEEQREKAWDSMVADAVLPFAMKKERKLSW